MIISAIDTNPIMVKAMQRYGIDARQGDITESLGQYDVVIAPGNSFGFMDGGVDWALACALGIDMADKVHKEIENLEFHELPVGECFYFCNDRKPDLLYAPTMRVPEDIRGTINVYLAVRSAIYRLHMDHNNVERVLLPGMGTGVGMLHPDVAAYQMAGGIHDAIHGAHCYSRIQGYMGGHGALKKGTSA